jgi:hypothetical protein
VLITVGLALMIWPGIVSHSDSLPHMNGVVRSMLGAVSLLALVGVFYPMRMLPVMFFELVWKAIWVVAFGLRPWLNGTFDAERYTSLGECVFGVLVVLVVVPWGFVFRDYFVSERSMRQGCSEGAGG